MDSSFLTGYEPVDAQHRQLFDAINNLMEVCEKGADRDGLEKSLNFLSDYTIKHFFDEEQFMKAHGFSDMDRHFQFHEAFKKVVRDLAHQFIFKGASEQLVKEVEDKIGTWLIEHIKGQDFRWAKELKEKRPELFAADVVSKTFTTPESTVQVSTRVIPETPAPALTDSTERAVTIKTPGMPVYASPPAPPAKPAAGINAAAPPPAGAEGKSRGILVKMTVLSSLVLFAAVVAMAFLSVYTLRDLSGPDAGISSVSGRLILVMGLDALALLIAGVFLNFSFTKVLVINPLKKITGVLEKVGEGDISQQIRMKSGDEIGEMAGHFDRTMESLKGLVKIIQNEAEEADDTGKDLSESMTMTTGSMHEINSGIQRMQRQIGVQEDSVSATNTAVNRIGGSINKLIGEIETQIVSVSQSSSAVEEMLSNIESVTHISRANAENVTRLAEASEVGRNGLQAVAADIQEVARESEGLLEINAVLQKLASQTNLLSMNAAIEAAHAGESGRGFAVVADEIRKLAESSGEQSKTISTVLKKIRNSMAKIAAATGEVLSEFEAIDDGVKTVSAQEEEICNAMEEQNAGSRQILETIQKLNETTGIVKSSSEEMRRGSGEIIIEGENLKRATEEIAGGINEMAARAGEINNSVTRVNSISAKNKTNINILRQAVSRFIIVDKYYRWDDSLAIGVEKVDNQHRQLFDAVNSLIDAIETGKSAEGLKKTLDFLVDYTVTHFADEEEIQRQCGFPDLENHHRIHEAFKKTAVELVKGLGRFGSSAAMIREVREKIGKWLLIHIKDQDSRIGAYIRAKERGNGRA
jgi:hemerythrin-like metal-binding protein